jgi:hypothetical protein
MKERLKNILPDLPALVVVLVCGAIGALLSCWWNLSIGEKEFASGVAGLPVLLRVFLGSFGAIAAVFILAKTDTSKLIHCGVIAALSGMAGPYLIIKALSTVVSVESNLVQIRPIGLEMLKKSSIRILRCARQQKPPKTSVRLFRHATGNH